MTAREDKLRRAIRLPIVMNAAENAIRFLLAAVLAGAEMFSGYAMCGIAVTAVSGAGVSGFSALIGACFGYLCFHGFVDSLRSIAACILVYAVSCAFWDVTFYRRSWFMPVAAAAINALVGFIYLSEGGWDGQQVIFFLTEVVLTAALTYFYRLAFSVWEDPREESGLSIRQTTGALVLACTLLITLAQIDLIQNVSLGRVLAALLTMLAGWKGGAGAGAAVGVMAGLSMDLAATAAPYYTMCFSFAGLLAGTFWKQGRLMTVLAYVVANAAAVLWAWEATPQMGLLYEVFVASVCFLLLPERLLRRLASLVRQDCSPDSARRAQEHTVQRLSDAAAAFRELSSELEKAIQTTAPAANNAAVFDRAADRVCVKCALREMCWSRDYQSTRSALNDALPVLLDKGRGTPADYPAWFSAKCVEIKAFSSAVNEELAALLARRQYQARARANRGAVCRQYAQLAGVLERAAAELSQELAPDPARQRRIQQRLAALGLEGESAVYYDENSHLRVEIAGTRLTVLDSTEERGRLSDLMGVPLRAEEPKQLGKLCLVESEPFMAVVGVAAREKDGQTVNGDMGAWFKDEAGRLNIFLCDGMGSGQAARADSTFAVELLEKFLKAGLEPLEALRTLNDSLALRGEESGGFTTIDLLRLDLFTGEGALYKLGAAPSYLRRGGEVNRLTGQSLPAGLTMLGNGQPDVLPLKLSSGDWLVMASDGVAGAEDEWISDALKTWEGESPRLLAHTLLDGAAHRQTPGDDRTVVVLKLNRRSKMV